MEIGAFPQVHASPAVQGMHWPEQELQAPTAQSVACVHLRPSSHLEQSGPPQSMSVSEPSLLPSLHVGPPDDVFPPLLTVLVPPLLVALPPLLAAPLPPLLVAFVPPLLVSLPPLLVAPLPPVIVGLPPLPVALPPLLVALPPLLAPPLPEFPPSAAPPSTTPRSCSGSVPTQTLSRHACPTMRQGSEMGLHTVRHCPPEQAVPSGHGARVSPPPQAAAAGSTHAAPRLV
jgi:hypothetical protein